MPPEHRVGFDIGGTYARGVLLNAQGDVLQKAAYPLDDVSVQGVLGVLQNMLHTWGCGEANTAVGVGLAAWLDVREGTVLNAPNLHWKNVPFLQLLKNTLRGPVRVMNDLDARVWAEWQCGAAQESQGHVVCVALGTGLGMGVVSHGRLLEGARGLATELGHIKVHSTVSGRMCGCGKRGCLEAYTSGKHLPALYASLHPEGAVLNHASEIEQAYVQGDAVAVQLWGHVAAYLARAVGTVVTLFNPRVLMLEGGVLDAAPSLKQQVVHLLPTECGQEVYADVHMQTSVLGPYAGALGAAWACMMDAERP
jgi:glucokinase